MPAVNVPVTFTVAAVTVPVNVGDATSAFVALAVAMLLNSVSISLHFTILAGFPDARSSFAAKLTDFT